MLRWLRSLFAWRRIRYNGGIWSYWENAVTGKRAVRREMSGGRQPIDWRWIDRDERQLPPPPGPRR